MDNTTIIKNAEEKERFNRKAIVCLVVALSLIVGFLVGSSIRHINASTDIKDPHPAYDVAHIRWFDMYLVRYTIADEATRNEFGPEPYISWLGIIYLIILYSILFLFPFRKNILKNASKKLRKGIYIFTVCFLLISLVSFFCELYGWMQYKEKRMGFLLL